MDKSSGKREWVYPLHMKGHFANLRKVAFVLLQAFLFFTPWIHISGEQIVRFDLPGRQMFVLGSIYGAHDTIFLLLVLLFLAFLLFFITALWGRLWCGYLCPQTVFLETFVHTVERLFEGTRGKRMQLDKRAWTANKVMRKTGKWTVFALGSGLISMTFVSWFAGTVPLWTGAAGSTTYGVVGAFSAGMFLNFTWFREQFCNFLCPYARFQGAIAGADSLVVSYDLPRGEPRRQRGVKLAKEEQGACIGCNKCVAVCPQGIDIRDGFQLECVSCAKCVDACTSVMDKFKQPTLVRYSTATEDEGGQRRGFLRPRTALYGALMAVCVVAFALMMSQRHALDVNVNRAPGTLYTVDEDGSTRNTFLMQIQNKQFVEEAAVLTVTVEGMEGAELIIPPIALETGEMRKVPLVVRSPAGHELLRTQAITIRVKSDFDEVAVATTFKSSAAVDGT
jgi:cytochrome c oxidase accessory protein FixG